MKILEQIKRIVTSIDMFYSSQMLRYDNDTEYKTVTGGIITISIVVLVTVGFMSMISDTFNRTAITASLDIAKSNDPTFYDLKASKQDMFMIGFKIQSMDLSQIFNLGSGPRYFDIIFRNINVTNGVLAGIQHLDLVQCTDEHWSMFPEIVEKSEIYHYKNWLCPKLGQRIPIKGSYTSSKQFISNVQISPCKNSTDPSRPCKPQSEIDSLFTANPNLYLGVYYINPVINPTETDYISYYL